MTLIGGIVIFVLISIVSVLWAYWLPKKAERDEHESGWIG